MITCRLYYPPALRCVIFTIMILMGWPSWAAQFTDALVDAADHGDIESVGFLLKNGSPVDSLDAGNTTALMQASYRGYRDIVNQLLEKGADVSLVNTQGDTALHIAVRNGQIDIVKLLLAAGAQGDVANLEGKTPVILAREAADPIIMNLLKKAQSRQNAKAAEAADPKKPVDIAADVDVTDDDLSFTPTPTVRKYEAQSDDEVLGVTPPWQIRELSADFTFQNPLVDAAEKGDTVKVIALLQSGYPAYSTGLHGSTALMRAAYHGYTAIVDYLLSLNIEVNDDDEDGFTALRMALEGHQHDIALKLIQHQAKIGDIRDKYLFFKDGNDVYYTYISEDQAGCDMYNMYALKGMAITALFYRTKENTMTNQKSEAECILKD